MRTDSLFRVNNIRVQADDMSESEVFHYSIPNVQQTGTGAVEDGNTVDSDKVLINGVALLVSKLNPRKGVVCKAAPKPGLLTVASSEFVQLEAQGVELDWAYRLYQSENIRSYLSSIVQSATRSHQRAAPSQIAKLWIVVPPDYEQRAIASFLDRETAKIDTLIAKKEKLIELLVEKRTALITQAVTKGLDPNVPMKDSGVEWLGMVPEHWEVSKISWQFRTGSGTTPSGEHWYGGDVPWITTSELREKTVSETTKYVTRDAVNCVSGLRIHPKGSLAIAMYGATIGRLGFLGVDAAVNQACCVLTATDTMKERFTYYSFLAGRSWIVAQAYGGGQPNLGQDFIRQLRMPHPSDREQENITAFLDRETARIDTLTDKVHEAIDRLKEYRTALISAAVTGKIDVRNAA
ncbi:MAG: restriction endonuclease subunit S [Rhodothermales bacterium]